DAPGSIAMYPQGINNAGVIVGYFIDSNNINHGLVRSPSGTITSFDAPNAAQGHTQGTLVYAVNNSGTCTGLFNGQDNLIHGFTRTPNGQFSVFNGFLNYAYVPMEFAPTPI